MTIKNFYEAIIPGTASENTRITVRTWTSLKTLWQGCAKDLAYANLDSWEIVEMLVDYSDSENHSKDTPSYNLGKILLVV